MVAFFKETEGIGEGDVTTPITMGFIDRQRNKTKSRGVEALT